MICCICGDVAVTNHAGFGMVCEHHARQLAPLQVASPAADDR